MVAQQTIPQFIAEMPLTVVAARAEKPLTHRMWFRAVLGGAALLIVMLVVVFFSGYGVWIREGHRATKYL
jgi:hypothetical protein